MIVPERQFGHYARSASEFYRYGTPFMRPYKLGPVVEVESPEAEAVVRELYPYDRPTLVRAPTLGEDPDTFGIPSLPLSAVTALLGIGVGFWGYVHRRRPLGLIALSVSGSMVAAAIVIAIRHVMK